MFRLIDDDDDDDDDDYNDDFSSHSAILRESVTNHSPLQFGHTNSGRLGC